MPSGSRIEEDFEALSRLSFEMSRLTRRAYNDLSAITVILSVFEFQKSARDAQFAELNLKKTLKEDARKTALRHYYHDFQKIDSEHLKKLQTLLVHQVVFFALLPELSGAESRSKSIEAVPQGLQKTINQILSGKTPSYWARSPEAKLKEIIGKCDKEWLKTNEFCEWVMAINSFQKALILK